jgi:putative flippase GtrA
VTLLPFVLVNLAGLAINMSVMQLSLKTIQFPEASALTLATVSTLAWNFIVSKYAIFRK